MTKIYTENLTTFQNISTIFTLFTLYTCIYRIFFKKIDTFNCNILKATLIHHIA